ncbi:MAG: hypothetical protein ACRCST_07020 [Turicibacter sp.]
MNNPKELSTFLRSFNLGAILTTLSISDILFLSQDKTIFFAILFMVIVNGAVIGVVMQYILIHTNITRNMVYAFINSKNQIPEKLLKMRHHNLDETLKMMRNIQLNVKKNVLILMGLFILLILSLFLPIAYGVSMGSKLVIFSIIWSVAFLARILLKSMIFINNSRYLVLKMDIIFKQYQIPVREGYSEHIKEDKET